MSPSLEQARRIALTALLASAVALTGAPSASAAGGCASASAKPGHASKHSLRSATLCLVNAERRSQGLHPLSWSRRLSRAARRHTHDMVRHRYFSHDSLSGGTFVDRIRRTGYLRHVRRWMVGENLAWGAGRQSTPQAIMRAWMHSPGHRANILTGRYREMGIGLSLGAPARTGGLAYEAATYATSFGSRR